MKTQILQAAFFFKGQRYRKGTPVDELPQLVQDFLPKRYKQAPVEPTVPQQDFDPVRKVVLDPTEDPKAAQARMDAEDAARAQRAKDELIAQAQARYDAVKKQVDEAKTPEEAAALSAALATAKAVLKDAKKG